MNNTTHTLIKSYIDSYDDIWIKYHIVGIVEPSIPAIELFGLMPINLKTKVKLDLFKTFGDSVTEIQFVKLLMRQTTGADFVNMVYLIKYYNLQFDDNNMIIWTDVCPYVNFKQETVNNWYIWHKLTTHNMFGRYMDKLLEFKLQVRLETNLFPVNENMKNDLCFINRNLVNATNEKQHETLQQQQLDAISIALHKMQGFSVTSFYTNSFVNIDEIKKNIYNNLCNNDAGDLDNVLNTIYKTHNIVDTQLQNIVKLQTCMMIRNCFKHGPLVKQKLNMHKFKKIPQSAAVKLTIANVLNQYLQIINRTVHKAIKNNKYLAAYISTLLNTLLSSCLNNFKFRQDYIQVVLFASLFNDMQQDLEYMRYVKTVVMHENAGDYKDFYDYTLDSFVNLKNTLGKLVTEPRDFEQLFKLKIKSLKDPNNTSVITLADVCSVFVITDTDEIQTFKKFLCKICKNTLDTPDNEIKCSWEQLQFVIFKYNKKTLLQSTLVLYYKKIDTIYEIMFRRLQADAKRFKCTPDTFNNYYARVHKKFSTVMFDCVNNMQNLFNDNLRMYKLKAPKSIVLEKAHVFVKTTSLDLTMIGETNLSDKYNKVIAAFDSVIAPNTPELYSESVIDNDSDDE